MVAPFPCVHVSTVNNQVKAELQWRGCRESSLHSCLLVSPETKVKTEPMGNNQYASITYS